MRNCVLLICFTALLLPSLPSVAQNRDRNGARNDGPRGSGQFNIEEFFARRNVYLTEKVGLSAEETAVFIPLDNELVRKKFEVRRDCQRFGRELRSQTIKTEEDFKKLLKCEEEVKDKHYQLDKEYLEKFKKLLSAEKILKYQVADREFFDVFMRSRE